MTATAGALAIAIALLLGSGRASAQTILDASCPGPEDVVQFLGGTNPRFAQTFTARSTGELRAATVRVLKNANPGDYVVQVNAVDGAGAATDTALASATVPDATVADGSTTITAIFVNPVTVGVGQAYALMVKRPASNQVNVGIRTGDDCPGELFVALPTLSPDPDKDLVFSTFVSPPPPPGTASPPATSTRKRKCKKRSARAKGKKRARKCRGTKR